MKNTKKTNPEQLNKQEADILYNLYLEPFINQRILSETSGHSLGVVNRSLKTLMNCGYLDEHAQLTLKSREMFKKCAPTNAIILAAGLGMRMVPINCRATIGVVGNGEHSLVNLGKAGRKRHMGIRPTVRGSVMNPNDHPHGGGEGKCGIGRPGPSTPWGKPALGLKTRKQKNKSNKLIVRRRDGKTLK